ncbi:NAD(P)-dependent oxidoreductase, partial [Vibrio vulnificus]
SRAGVIIGPGSAAFEIMRDFVYHLPVLIAPKWVDSKANPIALENLNHYLLCLAEEDVKESAMYEVGGPDTLSYREQFRLICQATKRPFRLVSTSLLTPKMASYWLGLVTSVPSN